MLKPDASFAPRGFQTAAMAAGLKKNGADDLALIYSEHPCQVAAAFTTNQVTAAPVRYDQEIIHNGKPVRAVIANAGNANACTGPQGDADAAATAASTAAACGTAPEEVLVLSTGVIGVPLPMEQLLAGVTRAAGALSAGGWDAAARAIMTTDTRPKICSFESPQGYRILGIAKGAGMIAPNMATMLAVIATDAAMPPAQAENLQSVWDRSFNRIVVDGDMSTNDTVLLLANGAAGAEPVDFAQFEQELLAVSAYLAKEIVRDGEGATKLVRVEVTGARSQPDAEQIARAIATSPLCKTAFYGADPNWGRIVCAAGYAGVPFDDSKLELRLKDTAQELLLFRNGQPADYDETRAIRLMQGAEWGLSLDLGQGSAADWVWTCDLSHDYVTINGHYRT